MALLFDAFGHQRDLQAVGQVNGRHDRGVLGTQHVADKRLVDAPDST